MKNVFIRLMVFLCLCAQAASALSETAQPTIEEWNALFGKTLADISSPYYTEKGNISARAGFTGQCTWYAYGRFYEVTGIPLETALHAKYWLIRNDQDERLNVLYGADKICYPSIAVSAAGAYGHVMFIEYVSEENGTPDMVYFTECNWDGNGYYDEGKDAVLVRLPFDLFVKFRMPSGYIAAKTLDS